MGGQCEKNIRYKSEHEVYDETSVKLDKQHSYLASIFPLQRVCEQLCLYSPGKSKEVRNTYGVELCVEVQNVFVFMFVCT